MGHTDPVHEVNRGLHRGVFCSLFDDPDFQQLTPPARLALLTLRLCAQNNASSMFRYYPVLLCVQTGYDPGTLETALRELESMPSTPGAGRWIEREGVVVWVRNGLRYDPNIRLADPKHRKGVERAVSALPRLPIVLRFCEYYRITRPFQDPLEALPRPLEGQVALFSHGPPIPKKLESEEAREKTESEESVPRKSVDGVDNQPDARPDPGSIRSALAPDSDAPVQRTGGAADTTEGRGTQRRRLTAEDDQARLEALKRQAPPLAGPDAASERWWPPERPEPTP